MIYLDNAATGGKKPDTVLTAVQSATRLCANPGRSGHKLALSCAKTVEACRNALNETFDGYGYDRVVFTKNCTEALNIALFGILQQGDHAVATCMEHNSVLRPLAYMKKQRRIAYDICPLTKQDDGYTVDVAALRSLIKPNTKLVIVTTASNVNGAIPDLLAIRKAIPKRVLLLCDGAQGGGHFPIRMRETGIDVLTLAGHKGLYALQGSGALLFSERVELPPFLYGGTGSMSISLDMPDFYPDSLEAGTLSFPAIVSLLEGVRFANSVLLQSQQHCLSLTAYLLQELQKLPLFTAYSKPNPCGIVCFSHAFLQAEHIAGQLSSKHDIAVRGGLHCAPLMHEALGTLDGGLTRVSLSYYTEQSEIDMLLSALQDIEKL